MNRDLVLNTLTALKKKLKQEFDYELEDSLKYLFDEAHKELTNEIMDRNQRFHVFKVNDEAGILDTLYSLDDEDKVLAIISTGFNISILVENPKGESGYSKHQLNSMSPGQKLALANLRNTKI